LKKGLIPYLISHFFTENGWLAAVPPCLGFAGWLFGGMVSKPVLLVFLIYILCQFMVFE
jgi:hypothetical protein